MAQMKIAAIQMTSGDDMAANIVMAQDLLQQAAQQQVQLAALPENAFYMRREGTVKHPDSPMLQHAGVQAMQAQARALGLWVLIGSIRALEGGEKPLNRSVLVSPSGEIAAVYDKLHLFDVTLPNGQRYAESAQALPGAGLTVAPLSDGFSLGMSVCYDLRFPGMYRAMALAGANLLSVPSAFTRPTGEAHWHTLLKARAIENAAYVMAPAQCGSHPGGRETYGHSLIIDPWGVVLAEADGASPGVITAVIDTARVEAVRAQIPVLAHHRADFS